MSQAKSRMLSKGLNVPWCAHSVLVSFAGVSNTFKFETSPVYKEHLPNDTDYIILGQTVRTYQTSRCYDNCSWKLPSILLSAFSPTITVYIIVSNAIVLQIVITK
jgi:hypothetical protein